jgi:hypothetical protein
MSSVISLEKEAVNSAPNLLEEWLRAVAKAAAICLEDQGHPGSCKLRLSGDFTGTSTLKWASLSQDAYNTWNDRDEAVENGACCIAIILAPKITGMPAIHKAKKGGGYDYFVAEQDALPFSGYRLEVSGIACCRGSDLATRVRDKHRQLEQSDDSGIPGLVIVTEFSRPESRCEEHK